LSFILVLLEHITLLVLYHLDGIVSFISANSTTATTQGARGFTPANLDLILIPRVFGTSTPCSYTSRDHSHIALRLLVSGFLPRAKKDLLYTRSSIGTTFTNSGEAAGSCFVGIRAC
jgi:hypothetical protein